jgi:hypothetical protein
LDNLDNFLISKLNIKNRTIENSSKSFFENNKETKLEIYNVEKNKLNNYNFTKDSFFNDEILQIIHNIYKNDIYIIDNMKIWQN